MDVIDFVEKEYKNNLNKFFTEDVEGFTIDKFNNIKFSNWKIYNWFYSSFIVSNEELKQNFSSELSNISKFVAEKIFKLFWIDIDNIEYHTDDVEDIEIFSYKGDINVEVMFDKYYDSWVVYINFLIVNNLYYFLVSFEDIFDWKK